MFPDYPVPCEAEVMSEILSQGGEEEEAEILSRVRVSSSLSSTAFTPITRVKNEVHWIDLGIGEGWR